jgi:leader peptidase (prepilin peptidase) / N-methyltransferase
MAFISSLARDFYDLPLPAFVFLAGLLSLLVGSFLNVVIVRLPIMMDRQERLFVLQASEQAIPDDLQGRYTLYTPASHCPQCKASVQWWMNIPVLSYLMLKGRCAGCQLPISFQYPLVEILTCAAGVFAALAFGVTGKACAIMALLWVLIALTVIDLRTQLLPDVLTLPLMWAGLLVNTQATVVPLSSAVWGAVVGYMSLWSIYQLFKLITGKEGMGYGDFKLLAALGAWLGVGMILPIVLFASLTGSVLGVAMILSKRLQPEVPIAFGPYLAAGGMLAVFCGERAVSWYLGLMKISP